MEKIRNYNVVSINEAIWRTGWNLEKEDFIQKINNCFCLFFRIHIKYKMIIYFIF